jgi:hypothetical protein
MTTQAQKKIEARIHRDKNSEYVEFSDGDLIFAIMNSSELDIFIAELLSLRLEMKNGR